MKAVTSRNARGPKRRLPGEPFQFLSTPLEQQIIARYAEVDQGGQVDRCGGLPIIKDRDAAANCARQLEVARGRRTHSYHCSWPGHYHVADGRPSREGDR